MRYLSSNDVAEVLGINISTLKRWTENGSIECTKTAGGHRKFTMQHIRDYYKKNKKSDKNLGLGLEHLEHKIIFDMINKNNFKELAQVLADSSLESDDLSVNTLINGLYMKGVGVEKICDKVVEPGSQIVENALRQGYISHIESFISRKLITRSIESLNANKPNGSSNGKSVLCINFEDNLPDLGVVMSEIIFRHHGYNVLNTGSHAELGNLKSVLEKRQVNAILFYLCNMQCCMATVEDNLIKTQEQISDIITLAGNLNIDIIFGGNGLHLLPTIKDRVGKTFKSYSDLVTLISNQ